MTLLNYSGLPLEDMALRRLVAILFTRSSILESIRDFHSRYTPFDPSDYNGRGDEEELESHRVWKDTVEDKLSREISKLGLPTTLLPSLNYTVGAMGLQVRKWKELHEHYLLVALQKARHFDLPVLQKMRFTSRGALDYRKTAEELVLSDALGIVHKYKLACLYCLEEYIPELWEKLPSDKKRYFRCREGWCIRTGGLGKEFWWPYIIGEQESELDDWTRSYRRNRTTFNQYAFEYSVEKGNKAAAEHFLPKLTDVEKNDSLMCAIGTFETKSYMSHGNYKVFPAKKCFELLSYLLSVMTPEQQERSLSRKPLIFLECVLHWPLQDMFLGVAVKIWNIFPDESSGRSRDEVLFFMYTNSEKFGEHSLTLFQKFFRDIPSGFWTEFVARQSVSRSKFYNILVSGRKKPLEICFRSLEATARKKLALSETAVNGYKRLMSEGKPDIVVVCLQDVSLSREEKKSLMKDLKLDGSKTRKWARLLSLLDETNDDSRYGTRTRARRR